MWDIGASLPYLALACAALALCLRRMRRTCRLSPFWFAVCLLHAALRQRGSNVERARASMRRLTKIAWPLTSYRGSGCSSLRRSSAVVGGVSVRWYAAAPAPPPPLPVIVFFHGGGWVVGDVDTHDAPCAALGERGGGCAVLCPPFLQPTSSFFH